MTQDFYPASGIRFPDFAPGSVWLVGAGPGDPGPLTLHALNALQNTNIIIYNALVDARILALAPETVERHYAGKRGGNRLIER